MTQCFRCGYVGKILVNMKIEDKEIPFCPECVRDYGLFLEGHVVNENITIDRRKVKE